MHFFFFEFFHLVNLSDGILFYLFIISFFFTVHFAQLKEYRCFEKQPFTILEYLECVLL